MIDLYYMPTPNTWKVSIMLEECGLPYRLVPVDISRGEQFHPDFLRISPNNKIPAIIDHDVPEDSQSVFESGAILLYLAEKAGRFLPASGRARVETLEWTFWQIGGLGPMAGQAHYFRRADAPNPSAIERYTSECQRLYGVLNRRLTGRSWIADEFSIADIASWGWVWFHRMHGTSLQDFPEVRRWFFAMADRPAVQRGISASQETLTPAQREMFLGPYFDAARHQSEEGGYGE